MIVKKRKELDIDFEGIIILLTMANSFGIAGIHELHIIIRISLMILSFFMAWSIISLRKYSIQKRKISKIKWSIDNLNFDYINSLGFKYVDKKYCFYYEQDKPYVAEILNSFIHHMERQFFKNSFPWHNETKKLSDEDFIMLYLQSYLGGLNLKDDILGDAPIKYSHREEKYTTIYTLSNAGFAFYRLLYIVEAYCERHEKIMNTGKCYLNTFNNEKVLNSGKYISYG